MCLLEVVCHLSGIGRLTLECLYMLSQIMMRVSGAAQWLRGSVRLISSFDCADSAVWSRHCTVLV